MGSSEPTTTVFVPPFRTSPSNIARYFFHACERFLRFNCTRHGGTADQGVPRSDFDSSPVMQAVLQAGYEWEEQAIRKLDERVAVASGAGPLHERHFTFEQTLDLLRTQPAGTFIYQPTLRPPAAFYQRFGVDHALVSFGDNRPDLLQVLPAKAGGRRVRVVDLKRGASMRATYRIQVLLYALQLELILKEQGITDAVADVATGAVWLGGQEEPETCDLASVRPHLEAFLRHDLSRVLTAPPEDVAWHLYFRCEWCGYFDHCRNEMRATDSISRLTQLSVNGKRHLVREAGVRTLADLNMFLKRKDADEVLGRCASLAGRRPHLRAQVDAFQSGRPVVGKASTPALPIWESVGVFLTLQHEPLGKKIYLAGTLVQVGQKDRARLFPGEAEPAVLKPRVWAAAAGTPEALSAVRATLVNELYDLLTLVHRFNQGKDWNEQLGVQCYVHSEHEKVLLIELLMEALQDVPLAERAMALLFHFQGPDLLLTDEHPEEAVQYPLVVLLGVVGRLLALPVEVTYGLPESLAALGSTLNYERKDYFHFPLGPGLKPDPIYLAWTRGRTEDAKRIMQQARMHLWAVRSLLTQLRDIAKSNLFAWPPKFFLPETNAINDPLLSRMAFFARYESVLGCLAVREQRAESREVLALLGHLVQLEAADPPIFKVIGDQILNLDEDGFPKYLLVRDTPEGRRAQMEFPDYAYRGKPYGKQHPHRAVAGVHQLTPDRLGFTRWVEVPAKFDGYQPKKGDRFLLYDRYTDFNSGKVVAHLRRLDAEGGGLFLQLIRDPAAASVEMRLPEAVERTAAAEEEILDLTPSQVRAYRRVREKRVVAIWGPPGTGKTHFLASMVIGMASAHNREGRPFRVLVTAFTHASIENVLRKISALVGRAGVNVGQLRTGKVGGWRGKGDQAGEDVEEKAVGDWLAHAPIAVVGATAWACTKEADSLLFDLVIIDEASQLKVPDSSIAVSRVAGDGRLVLAGDHMQLPPIVAGVYPEPAGMEPVLHRSIFELVLSRSGHGDPLAPNSDVPEDDGDGLVCQLLENWRMNDVLTSYASALVYGPKYTPASDDVAARRLKLKAGAAVSQLVEVCLDPEYPLVVVSIEGAAAAKENAVEAGLVADLVVALRDRLRDRTGHDYADDANFFRDGVFVVSPHHVQIRLIRTQLAQRRRWTTVPFVDTVDKMQGQEADAVVVSYGVSDTEFALREAAFIYGLNRLNVAVTRAKSKCVVCLPGPLLVGTPEVLDIPEAERGLAYMRRLAGEVESNGEIHRFHLSDEITARVLRTSERWRVES